MYRMVLILLLGIVVSANLYGDDFTSDGHKCLSEAEELALKARCSDSGEGAAGCESVSGWYFDLGRLSRAECDLLVENRRLENALKAVKGEVNKIDQSVMLEDGMYPSGYPVMTVFDQAQDAWTDYVSLHCNEVAGPRGAGLSWHADVAECRIKLVRQRTDYLTRHWSLSSIR